MTRARPRPSARTRRCSWCPYYNKPSQEGLYRHFRAIAEATRNCRSSCTPFPDDPWWKSGSRPPAGSRRIVANVVAIKEAGGSVDRISQLRAALPPDFTILSGDDALTLPYLAAGATGVISVTSNVIPGEIARMVGAFRHGKLDAAQALHHRFYPLA